ncbi:MAG: dihydrolipoyl dehydrogenase [Gammaproteobacteria bacterium]|nr:dihydrolipoyl dehydrogenase [Gammaproteobacteria bacterium]MDH3448456.1 dihydrolipoyl dehydrogenase [Gammaproteobacteria bacterium]
MSEKELLLPDIGDFDNVEVIEIHVTAGDQVKVEDPILTLESEKATMDIPSPFAGTIKAVTVKVGDRISEGNKLGTIDTSESGDTAKSASPEKSSAPAKESPTPEKTSSAPSKSSGDADMTAEVVVLGAGPGGYTAAFRAADLGKKVILVERYEVLGGVCLNVGCIPSKALLHTAQIINEASHMQANGVTFGKPKIDLKGINAFKSRVVGKLTGGLSGLARQRKVTVVHGVAEFIDQNNLQVTRDGKSSRISFEHCIIAAGSQATQIPSFPNDDARLMDSTGALELSDIPRKLLIVGGGIIGLEMATVYDALGSEITVVEFMDSLIPGCDKDLVRGLTKIISKRYKAIHLKTRVSEIKAQKNGLKVSFEGDKAPAPALFDKVLVAVGRRPNGHHIGADKAGISVDDSGFIPVDKQMRTNVANIFAIGDIVGNPMLAHKATHEGKVAAEVIAGMKSYFEPLTIPSVAYTDPEVAWMGLSESEAREQGIEFEKGAFPWAASGRSLGIDRDEGLTKVLFDKESKRIIGAGIVGPNAGELIAEAVLALEMGADAEDIGLTIHPHPTLSETFNFAAEMAEGTITDLYLPRKK